MANEVVPEDLKDVYRDCLSDKVPSNGWRRIAQTMIERIAAAEADSKVWRRVALAYKYRHESGGPLSDVRPDSCRCTACDLARAALQKGEAKS